MKLYHEQKTKLLKAREKSREREVLINCAMLYAQNLTSIQANSSNQLFALSLNENISNEEFLELSKEVAEHTNKMIEDLGKRTEGLIK